MKTTDDIRQIWNDIRWDISSMDFDEKVYWIETFLEDIASDEAELIEMIRTIKRAI